MAHFTPEQIETARRMDLLTYLQTYEPGNLVLVSNGTYCTKEHDSLKISNGMWHWFSRDVGGRSALDYLIVVKGYSFQQGIETILGQAAALPSVFVSPAKQKKNVPFSLPEMAENNTAVVSYLRSRGLCNEVIRFCIRTGRVYEGITGMDGNQYHNAVFVGTDINDKPQYANLRGINTSFKGDAAGSDKRYSFSIPAEKECQSLHLFEAAIDLLSFATLEKMRGQNWRSSHLLSLAGIYDTKNKENIPIALEQYLSDHKEIRGIYLHLDNDKAGRSATQNIMDAMNDRYVVYKCPPRYGKDVNDELVQTIKNKKKEELTR